MGFNLLLLGFFKYTDFFLENLNFLGQFFNTGLTFNPLHIVLPLALSFITFQQIAFLVDCYKSLRPDSESMTIYFIDYAVFISFFPQLIAGPIVHHKEILPQLKHIFSSQAIHAQDSKPAENLQAQTRKCPQNASLDWEMMARGIFIFFIGLFKKVFIAEGLGEWADAGFRAVENGQMLNLLESWATSLCYTFQLYFDFSGYCDMAIGLGLLFGITLPINFNSPYKTLNITDFWRRWHITLGRFFKQYLYIPLGGNKNETYKKYQAYHPLNQLLTLRNLFIVAFLSGVWHGAGFGFIIWGTLHGLGLLTHRIYQWMIEKLEHYTALNHPSQSKVTQANITTSRPSFSTLSTPHSIVSHLALRFLYFRESRVYKALCWILTFLFVSLAWVFFRAKNIDGALTLLSGMFSTHLILPTILQPYLGFLQTYDITFGPWAVAILDSSTIVFGWIILAFILCLYGRNSTQWINVFKPNWFFFIILISLSLTSFVYLNKVQQFLYFNF